jgi:Family of unknown function (DUF6221)
VTVTPTWLYDVTLPPDNEFQAWLTARLDEDWSCASAAGHGDADIPYGRRPNGGWVSLDLNDNVRPTYDTRFARHHGPRRVVAEVEAKRELLDLHSDRAGYCNTCGGRWPCLTLQIIAAPYADTKRTTYRETP